MAKATIQLVVTPNKQTISRQAESFCINPSVNVHNLRTTDCHFSQKYGFVKIDEQWNPELYPWDKNYFEYRPVDPDLYIESNNALGKNDWAVGFAGDLSNPNTTPWSIATKESSTENQALQISFMWNRPTSTTLPSILICPRLEINRVNVNQSFAAYCLMIDNEMKMRVYEYPYDHYDAFIANANNMFLEVFRHPLVVTPDEFASKWQTIRIIPLGPSDILVLSDMLMGGGFLYKSTVERVNIPMNPSQPAAFTSYTGGVSQVHICPLDLAATGTFKSEVLSKSVSDATYPTLKVIGWSPSEASNDGYLDSVDIPAGATGYAGIKYEIYSVVNTPDWVNFNDVTETLVPATGGAEFKDFKYKITLTSDDHVSPVINNLIFEYTGSNETWIDEPIDISQDVKEFTESISSELATYKAGIKLINRNGEYNALAERPMNEIAVNVAGTDIAVLYTLNTGYQWWQTPTQPALELDWECGDGWEYLRNELVVNHPAYDGQLLSEAMTGFMNRIGFDASRLEITATTGLYLPKKRANEKYQYKPENGTPAIDFVNKLKEWFRQDWDCRFKGDGTFLFAPIVETLVDNIGVITPAMTFYPHSLYKTTPDDYVLYQDAKVELLHDEFFNEIWVVGEDSRTRKPIISIYQNLPSQTDKNAPDYIGRRRIMIVPTTANRADAVYWILAELVKHYGKLRSRVTFNTRNDPLLKSMDFISIYGCANLWRVDSITNNLTLSTMTSSIINSATPAITGTQIVATQWPVSQ